jgi:hypothetical protein
VDYSDGEIARQDLSVAEAIGISIVMAVMCLLASALCYIIYRGHQIKVRSYQLRTELARLHYYGSELQSQLTGIRHDQWADNAISYGLMAILALVIVPTFIWAMAALGTAVSTWLRGSPSEAGQL